ncbi:sensor histidine kinase [Reticulomyxa filosa]|uniref:Sensor histidine kinase n=1 Tax=Reticulomyxa filosa TaxID=46433 RepID=X6P5E3_RETFI|nr:sensor histidine kinase [Reticulomyxa filosa]|eukprot:ETO33338.1 sensor histidine kinase [Reticulomyxa filosa]
MKKVASMQLKRLRDKMPVNNTTSANLCSALQVDYRQLCEQNSEVRDALSTENIDMALRKGVELGMLRIKEVTLIEEDPTNPTTATATVTTATTATATTTIATANLNPNPNPNPDAAPTPTPIPNTIKRSQVAYVAHPRAVKALDIADIEGWCFLFAYIDFVELWKRNIPHEFYTTADKVKWRAPWMGREIMVQWDGEKEAYKAVVQLVQGWNTQLNRPVARRKKQYTDGYLKIQYTLDSFSEEINPDVYDWYFAKPGLFFFTVANLIFFCGSSNARYCYVVHLCLYFLKGQFSKHFLKKLRTRGMALPFLTETATIHDDKRGTRKRSRQEFEKMDVVDGSNDIDVDNESTSPQKKRKLEAADNAEHEKLSFENSQTAGTDISIPPHINDNVLFQSPTNNYFYYGTVINVDEINKECGIQFFKRNSEHCSESTEDPNDGNESDAIQSSNRSKIETVKWEHIAKQIIPSDDILRKVCGGCGRYFEEISDLEEHKGTTGIIPTEPTSNS